LSASLVRAAAIAAFATADNGYLATAIAVTPGSTSHTRTFMPFNAVSLRAELEELMAVIRPDLVATRGRIEGDAVDVAGGTVIEMEIEQLDARIKRLTARLEAQAQTSSVPVGVAGVGKLLSIDFGDGPETYRLDAYPDTVGTVATVTIASPLGAALLGATVGQHVTYASPRGQQTVTVLTISDPLTVVA
jgi:transcription elongation factor GreA